VLQLEENVGRQTGSGTGLDAMELGTTGLEDIPRNPALLLAQDHVGDAWSEIYPRLSSLPRFEGQPSALRVCIATEDIVGPARNGGIGTTYAALATLLSDLGHQVTILYLKGHEVENETIEHWVDFYAAKNIRFEPVPDHARAVRYSPGRDRSAHASYNMFRYLLEHPMDVVHVSEWQGAGYLSLLAKRQGLAFRETLFVVKASSPWLWAKLYGLQPLERLDDLARIRAERQSIELADLVVGGSLHLLRWMGSQGYRLPADRTFVQPNVGRFDELRDLIDSRHWAFGTRHPIEEIVFFGRLEVRKGLLIFIRALKRLIRQGVALPPVSFLGKPGAPLWEHVGEDAVRYIRSQTSNWPIKVEVLPDFQQNEALRYLLSGSRLAVMPSVIENSSLAVFEAVNCRIPFVASDSGGTPELIAPADQPHVLCPPHAIPLAEKLADVLARGGFVAAPSFDNEVNLEEWRQFHLDLGRGLRSWLAPAPPPVEHAPPSISVCIYHAEADEKLRSTLQSLQSQDCPAAQILVAVDSDDGAAMERAVAEVAEMGMTANIVPAYDLGPGQALNLLAGRAEGALLLFVWSGSLFRSSALSTFARVAAESAADALTCFSRVVFADRQQGRPYLSGEMLGDIAQRFFHTDITPMPLLVRREIFGELGGFTSDERVLAHDHEFVAKAQLSGCRCQTIPHQLCTVDGWSDERLERVGYSRTASEFRSARPQLGVTPLALRETLLMARGLQKALGRRGYLGGSPGVRRAGPKQTARLTRLLALLTPAFVGFGRSSQSAGRRGSGRLQREPLPGAGFQEAGSWWQSSDGRRYSGRLYGVHDGKIHGWIRCDDEPGQVVELEGELGKGRLRVARAGIASHAVIPVRGAAHGHGFALPVWRLHGLRGDWRSRHVVLRVKGTDLVIGEFTIPADRRALEAAGFDGYCDVVGSEIRGWVWQPSEPDTHVDVAAFVDGKFLARTTANGVRDDLRAADVGTGAYGFALSLPKRLRDGTAHRVDIVVADCGTLLKHGRFRLKGRPART
jgi:glycosyltransferase involved in cell wall biosynthesis